MRFDHGDISPIAGKLSAHVFENRATGVPRSLYWSLYIQTNPVRWADGDWSTAVLVDWLTWSVDSWSQLEGCALADVLNPDLVESSFYLCEHNDLRLSNLKIGRRTGTAFDVRLSGEFDLDGFEELDGVNYELQLECTVSFEGVTIVPDNLFPKPSSQAEAKSVLSPFLNIEEFDGPRREEHRFIFEPRADAV